ETMPGMVVNTLPLRIDLGGRPAFEDLVRRVHEVVVQAHAAQDVPLSALVERLAPPRDASRSPLFQAMFSFHDTPLPDFDVAGLRATVLERHNGSAKSDLNVIAIPRGESITLIWEHAADLFRDDTMRRMVER